MATKNACTPDPPIFTADRQEVKLGQILYGLDTDCSEDKIPVITPLQVIQIDLGARRKVRLLRQNGTEWTWSPTEYRGSCRTSEHLLYTTFDQAKKAAIETLSNIKVTNEDLRNAEYDLRNAKEALKDAELELKKAKAAPNLLANKIATVKKQKQPKHTFKKLVIES